jgi:hypothetical protein
MSLLENIRNKALVWLIPSKWVQWLNGHKTYLGILALALWAAIYAIPMVCHTEICVTIALVGGQIKNILIAAGLDLGPLLLNLGSILVTIGLTDKLLAKKITKIVIGLLKLIEEPIAKLIEKGEAAK